MQPEYVFFAVFAMIVIGAQHWRRRKVRRAALGLPTRAFRLLGPEPFYALPEGDLPEALQDFAALQRRAARVQRVCWALAALWAGFVIYLELGGVG